jgi:alpha-D-ribose 1-methylphosphonate 5-triphosphate diphosphatase
MSLILTNATLLLPEAAVTGTVVLDGTLIGDVQPGHSHIPGAVDLGGDFLLPGAVDLHTDNLERQVEPRAGARWPSRAAFLAHDAQCAAAGITTVLDSFCLGDLGFDEDRSRTSLDGVADLDALRKAGLLKCDHRLHLRCEVPAPGTPSLLAALAGHPVLAMVSLMDHTPGIGQYGDLARYRDMRRRDGEAPNDTEQRIATLTARRTRLQVPNRAALLDLLRDTHITLASHDDRTEAEIETNIADGIGISEFPVTMAAAMAARAGGMRIIGGAPNIVRGGSHSGNVAASALLQAGLLDALASDYVPASLIHAAFIIAEAGWRDLPRAVTLVGDAPARMIGLADRGRIAPGLRADLVRVRLHDGLPLIRAVYGAGERIA